MTLTAGRDAGIIYYELHEINRHKTTEEIIEEFREALTGGPVTIDLPMGGDSPEDEDDGDDQR